MTDASWIQTYTGRAFYPLDPKPDDVYIEDIAHSLANLCRYGGHCRHFYSVAQHSVYVSRHVSDKNRLWGLLHDASEAYLVDVPRPIKPRLHGYLEIEDRVMRAVAMRFNLEGDIPEEVKRVDAAILADESKQLMGDPPKDWGLTEPPLGIVITKMSPEAAKDMFIAEFRKIVWGIWYK